MSILDNRVFLCNTMKRPPGSTVKLSIACGFKCSTTISAKRRRWKRRYSIHVYQSTNQYLIVRLLHEFIIHGYSTFIISLAQFGLRVQQQLFLYYELSIFKAIASKRGEKSHSIKTMPHKRFRNDYKLFLLNY